MEPTQRTADPTSLGPLGQRLSPDLWVRSAASFDPQLAGRLTGLVPSGHVAELRVGTLPVAGPGGPATAVVAGVDPAAFRAFTSRGRAELVFSDVVDRLPALVR